jgi:hypothetical protein
VVQHVLRTVGRPQRQETMIVVLEGPAATHGDEPRGPGSWEGSQAGPPSERRRQRADRPPGSERQLTAGVVEPKAPSEHRSERTRMCVREERRRQRADRPRMR